MALEFITIKDATGVDRKVAVDVFATDNHAQIAKLGYGVEDAAPTLVSSTDPMPVTLATRLQSDIDSVSSESKSASFRAADYVSAVAASASDVFVLGGSATKTLKVWSVYWILYATGKGTQLVTLHKRTSADTGGTSQNMTRVAMDSSDAASASDVVARKYTANPTVGTDAGILFGVKSVVPEKSATTLPSATVEADFFRFGAKPIVLRGVAQQLAINCEGSILAGLEMTAGFVWTEE